MRIAYFDSFSGLSGDKIIGALLSAGLDMKELEQALSSMPLSGYSLHQETVVKQSITGVKFSIAVHEESEHRNIKNIEDIFKKSSLEDKVVDTCISIFNRIAEVEARIHNTGIDRIHFHEVGAVDSIIDIAGTVIGLQLLGIEKVYASKIPLGTGFIESAHGKLPVPAPATVELLTGLPVYSTGIEAELTTPTGAALISSLASDFGPIPQMKIDAIGYGAGTRDLPIPNHLRLFIGEAVALELEQDRVVMIETNIDDMNPEFYEYVSEQLMSNGAIDVFYIPIIMKKTRPGVMIKILTDKTHINQMKDILFSETTSSGMRILEVERSKLKREERKVKTRYGTVSVKVMLSADSIVTVSPEYEECKRLAKEHNVPIKDIYDEAKAEAIKLKGK